MQNSDSMASQLKSKLRIPAIAAPLFIISWPKLVIAQCKAGMVGSFPALNARPISQLDEWLDEIISELDSYNKANPERPAAPFAVNQIVNKTNQRLMQDMQLCVKYKVPIVISSLGAVVEVNQAIHSYGGLVLHDVINNRFAHKAIEKGADGLIAVAAGAGGHFGPLSPFALLDEIRQWFAGPLALSGAITKGSQILAAEMMGADFAYIGSAFIATDEARASDAYRQMIVDSKADDVVASRYFTGVMGNYLKQSIVNSGLDPANLPDQQSKPIDLDTQLGKDTNSSKAWRDIWGAGQGVGGVHDIVPTATRVERLVTEYQEAVAKVHAQFHQSMGSMKS